MEGVFAQIMELRTTDPNAAQKLLDKLLATKDPPAAPTQSFESASPSKKAPPKEPTVHTNQADESGGDGDDDFTQAPPRTNTRKKGGTRNVWTESMTKFLISCVTKHPDCRQKTKFKRQQSDAWDAICGEITDAYPQIKNVKQVKDRWQNLQKRFKLNVDSKNPNAKEATGRGRSDDGPYQALLAELLGKDQATQPDYVIDGHNIKVRDDKGEEHASEGAGASEAPLGTPKAPSNIEKSVDKGKRPLSRSSEKKGKRPKTPTSESIAFVSDEDCTVLSDEEDDDLADILGVASGVSDPSSTRVLNASRRKIIETREAIKPFLTHMKSAERRAREQQQQLFQMQQQNNIESQYMMFTAMGHKVPMPLHMQERLVEAAKMSAAEADKVLPPVAPVDKVPEPPTEPPAASAPVAPAPPPVTPVPFNGYESPELVFMEGMSPQRQNRLRNMHRRILKSPANHPTSLSEVAYLHSCLALSGTLFMPCAGTRGFVNAVQTLYAARINGIFCQDVDRKYPALDAYGDCLAERGLHARGYSAIICSPPFLIADLLLAWAVEQAVGVIVLHVAGDYFSNAPEYRRRFLQAYEHNGLMLCISGLPLVPGRKMRRCMFLVLFKNIDVRRQTLKSYKWEFEQTNPRLKSIHLEILETDNIYYASEYHPWLANVQNQQVGQTFHYKGRQGLTIGEATRQFMAALTLAGDPDYLEHHQGPPEMCSDYEEEESQFEEADVVVPATQLDAADTADTADVEGGDADAAVSVEGSGSDSDETQL
ncbi:hypothetical protein CYMTET_34645 [Cymbomonas tetramitiformis]|uniref:Myb/SANT-like DNA-binding domain-containing protein n=1 Tax=Cymbomonas tetramitiformis TaxID=36881 RepID=A0AAE0FAQ0_9CHLO|nr:hypothetical protein CYMTET_34645 [Cymbomonas tetramitiformis]